MKAIICSSCGASRWKEDGRYRTCLHCGTLFEISPSGNSVVKAPDQTPYAVVRRHNLESTISIGGDVTRLLHKCRTDPTNAFRYANLVLDIDPTNEEALMILYGRRKRR